MEGMAAIEVEEEGSPCADAEVHRPPQQVSLEAHADVFSDRSAHFTEQQGSDKRQ